MLLSYPQLLLLQLTRYPPSMGPTPTTGQLSRPMSSATRLFQAQSMCTEACAASADVEGRGNAEGGPGLAIHHLCCTKKGKLFTHPPFASNVIKSHQEEKSVQQNWTIVETECCYKHLQKRTNIPVCLGKTAMKMALAGGESMKSHPQKRQLSFQVIKGRRRLCASPGHAQTWAFPMNQLYLCSVSSVSRNIKNKHQDLGILFSQRSSKCSLKSPELIIVSLTSLLLQSFAEQWSYSIFLPLEYYFLLINQVGFRSVAFKIRFGLR